MFAIVVGGGGRKPALALLALYLIAGIPLTFFFGTRVPALLRLERGHEHQLDIDSALGGAVTGGTVSVCLRVQENSDPPCEAHGDAPYTVHVKLNRDRFDETYSRGPDGLGILRLQLDQAEAIRSCGLNGAPVRLVTYTDGRFWSITAQVLERLQLSEYDLLSVYHPPHWYVGIYLTDATQQPFLVEIEFLPRRVEHRIPWYRWLAAFLYDLVLLPVNIVGWIAFGPG